MKTCSFCDSELRPSEGEDLTTCWLCGGNIFIDETEEEARERRIREQKKELCCSSPHCPPQLRASAERHCADCGEALEKATLQLWLEKCVKPALKKGVSDLTPTIEMAWLMGFSREAAQERLNEHIERNGAQDDDAQEESQSTEMERPAIVVCEEDVADFKKDEDPVGGKNVIAAGGVSAETGNAELWMRFKIVLLCLLLFIPVALYLWPRNSNSKPPLPSQSPTPTPNSPSAQLNVPPGMTYVPGGEFMMGREQNDGGDKYESPSHPARVKPFFMDIYEVSRDEYQRCVEVDQCPAPQGWEGRAYPVGTGKWPVTGVDWKAADTYAKWAGKRLPTEEEWEFAARGFEDKHYPWGHEWQQGLANANGERDNLANVGEYKGKSPFGLFDMVGNAWEWTSSTIHSYLQGRISEDALPKTKREQMKVIRGGCYLSDSQSATVTYRRGWPPPQGGDYAQTGFRCAMDIKN
jgi:formylglycine-generating enzyme required for sulfatase activity